MHRYAQGIACSNIGLDRRSDDPAIDLQMKGFTGKRGQGLSDHEPEFGVETQRTSVVSSLYESDVRDPLLFGACEDCSHEFPPNVVVLMSRFYRYWSNGVDARSFVEEIAPDDTAGLGGNDSEEQGIVEDGRARSGCCVHRWEIVWETVLIGDPRECGVAHSPALFGIGEMSLADVQGWGRGAGHSSPNLLNVADGRYWGRPAATEVFRSPSRRPSRYVGGLCV
jgi:hypothetical protein